MTEPFEWMWGVRQRMNRFEVCQGPYDDAQVYDAYMQPNVASEVARALNVAKYKFPMEALLCE